MRVWRCSCFSLVLVVLLSSLTAGTAGAAGTELPVAVAPGTSVLINASAGVSTHCGVCVGQACGSSLALRSDARLSFSCSHPEREFSVQIITDTVKLNIDPQEHPAFQKFNRTFIWNLKPPAARTTHLNFSRTGLRQIQPTDGCPDKHAYTLTAQDVSVGRFCQNGSIRRIDVPSVGRLSLEVSGGQALDAKAIDVSLGPAVDSLANIHVVLPERNSTQEFFTPNTFPENAETMWYFHVPHKYYTDVHILRHTVPTCLTPENIPTMKYTWLHKDPLVKPLNGSQPLVETGNFNLSIKNCKMSWTHPPVQSLMVHFQISAIKRNKGQCEGDLPEKQTLQIRVMRKDPTSACVLKLDSVIRDAVTMAPGNHYHLDFFDCSKDELELTVNQTIECKEWRNCAFTPFPITFSFQQPCIPGVVKAVTWQIYGPQKSAVELRSPSGGLRHCLPEDACHLLLQLALLSPAVTLGQFCPKGAVQKIQIRESKIAVTASVTSYIDIGNYLATKPFLTYSFTQDISEHYIFTVAPKPDDPAVLVTPAWPSGMKNSSTVSWIVNLEPQIHSNLKFRNVSQSKCREGHTSIAVQDIRSQKVLYRTDKDENIKDVSVSDSFYLNMTNCKAPTGSFRAMMEITRQNNTNKPLVIVLSVVGAVFLIITAVGICIVLRKKKRNKAPPVSVYNPSHHAFLPSKPSALEEEDPHTYAYIDDTLVYGHLLEAEHEESAGAGTDESAPPLPDRAVRKGQGSVPEGGAPVDRELYGYIHGQSHASALKASEDGAYDTRLCV